MANIDVIVGSNIKRMRKQGGFTQEHLASYLGIDQTLVSKIESGQRSIGVASLESLCDLLFCSLDDLLVETPPALAAKNVAFRANELNETDLRALSAIGRIVRNLEDMASIEKAAEHDR